MAIYYARAAGNVNAAIWATTPTGTASNLFSSFTNADTLMANNFVVTLNVSTTVLEIRNDTTGGATAGGRFDLNAGVTLTANVFGGTTNNATCLAYSSLGTATIIGNIKGGASAGQTNGNGITFSGASGSILNITGNVTGGDTIGANSNGIFMTNTGTLNITGTVTGGTSNQNYGVSATAGIVNIIGNVTGTTGSCVGAATSNGTINITGNVTGGFGSAGIGALLSGIGTINITGVVTGGGVSNAPGVQTTGNGTVVVIGTSIGGAAAQGVLQSASATITVTRAKGNGFGSGSSGLTAQPGVQGAQNGLTRVYEIEYGDLGQSPTSGPVFLFPATSNVALFYRPTTTKKTLVDAANSSGLLPSASDVRRGVSYNAGNNIGTMDVPAAASVALGVGVDNTTGTAVLTTGNIGDIWNYPVSGISVTNSIGERLKNCSTIATMGQQLASSLTNIN